MVMDILNIPGPSGIESPLPGEEPGVKKDIIERLCGELEGMIEPIEIGLFVWLACNVTGTGYDKTEPGEVQSGGAINV